MAASLALVGGCANSDSVQPSATPLVSRDDVTVIARAKRARLLDPVWLPALGRIVFTLSPAPGDAFRMQLASVGVDDAHIERLRLPDVAGCRYTSKALPEVLGDGRLGYVEQCWPGGGDVVRLMAWNAHTGRAQPFVRYRLRFQQGPFTCAPDVSTCVINNQAGLEEELERVGAGGLEPLDLPLGRAGFPRWSPDGRWVALDAIPEGDSASGMESLGAPRNLYLLAADLRTLRPLVREATDVTGAAWSSDSRWLAVGLRPRDGQEGLYLVHVATGRLLLVRPGQFGAPAWLPGDNRLVVSPRTDLLQATGGGRVFLIRLPDGWRTRS